MKLRTLLLATIFLGAVASVAMARTMQDMNIAVLRTIDKISARTRTFEVPVDKTVKFGSSLFIRVRACRKSSPLDQPESAAFLQIWEKKATDYKSAWVFSGWMFASNPSLSAMEHPVYDVWVIDCKNETTSAKQEFSSEKAPEGAPIKSAPVPTSSTPTPETPKAEASKPESPKPETPKSEAPPAKSAPAAETPAAPAAPAPAEAAPSPAKTAPASSAPAPTDDDPDAGSDDH